MMVPGYPGHSGSWLAMGLMMVAFWTLVVLLAVVLVRAWTRTPGALAVPSTPADDVLAERYARGEIDDDEFQRRRRALHSSRAGR